MMKYPEVMSLTNLRGKFERSNEEEREKYKGTVMHVTEKVHGENWRLGIVEGKKVIGGRKHLFYWDEIAEEFIHEYTHKPHPNWTKINEETKAEIFRVLDELVAGKCLNIILYGELYGNSLQGRFKFEHEGYAVIYYEVAIDNEYVDQAIAFGWFEGLEVKSVPYFGIMTLQELLDTDVEELESKVAMDAFVEGIVGIPAESFVDDGRIPKDNKDFKWDFADRFIVKKKTKKFAETKTGTGRKGKVKRKSPFAIHMTEERLNHVLADLKEDGHMFSHEKDFRFLVVEALIKNIQNEENEGVEFNKDDKKSLGSEGHKLFSQYAVL